MLKSRVKREAAMETAVNKRITRGLLLGVMLLATVSVLPVATADTDDVIDGYSKLKADKPGENLSATCDTTADNLEKKGKLVYDVDTGGLKYDSEAANGESARPAK
jgi:hypothetical protein